MATGAPKQPTNSRADNSTTTSSTLKAPAATDTTSPCNIPTLPLISSKTKTSKGETRILQRAWRTHQVMEWEEDSETAGAEVSSTIKKWMKMLTMQ